MILAHLNVWYGEFKHQTLYIIEDFRGRQINPIWKLLKTSSISNSHLLNAK